jgi:lysylphosphatidylglycerol synthetase-like protein (DUF2156 family)
MPPAVPPPAGRPTGATVITVIEGILGVLFLLVGLFVGFIGGTLGSLAGANGEAAAGGVLAGVGIVFGVIVIAIGVLYLLIAYGVWKARGWAWMLGMVVSIIVLVFAVLGLGNGVSASTIVSIALPAIVVYFLWTPEVKRYLGRA